MPGNISNAAPSSVFPQTLLMSFSESREYAVLKSTMHDGTQITGQLAATSRRTFRLTSKLTSAQLATLRAFWVSLNGGQGVCYFYNPYEGSPVGSNYDATGVSVIGRYTVRFIGDNWSQSTDMQRTTVPNLGLIETA